MEYQWWILWSIQCTCALISFTLLTHENINTRTQVQQAALSAGAWISQDYVRKANAAFEGPFVMHGNTRLGYEVMPDNVALTVKTLRLSYEEWDYTSKAPQSESYLLWLKKHLAKGSPVVFFPICKGDDHECYATSEDPTGACPNHGSTDHVEVMYGLFSKHDLSNIDKVYDSDVIVHTSDQDLHPYYRTLKSLPDTLELQGNCKSAQPGFGKNEMYPCIDSNVTYGVAVSGLDFTSSLPKVSLVVNIDHEPNVRQFQKPVEISGNVTVSGLTEGTSYVLYRYDGTENVPKSVDELNSTASFSYPFVADSAIETLAVPDTFSSHSATYFIVA